MQGGSDASYVPLTKFRHLTPWSTNEVSDTVFYTFATEASRLVRNAITTEVKLERVFIGSIDGTNTLFYTKFKPIADIDFDSDVDEDDIKVYYATQDAENQISYGSEQTVTAVDLRAGRFTVETAPTTTTAEMGVYITYRHTVENIDYDLVKLAATYLCAHFVSLKIRGESPNYKMIGAPYTRKEVSGIMPGEGRDRFPFLAEYHNTMAELLGHSANDGVGFSNVIAVGLNGNIYDGC